MILMLLSTVNRTASSISGTTEIWGIIITVLGFASPIIVEIVKGMFQKKNTLPTVSQQINSNNKIVYVDNRKHIISNKTVVNSHHTQSMSSGSDNDVVVYIIVGVLLLCVAAILSIVILKNRVIIAIIMDLVILLIGILIASKCEKKDFYDCVFITAFGMILPYFSLINLYPPESFDQYRDSLIFVNNSFPEFLNHLMNGISANKLPTLYYISIATGIIIAVLYIYFLLLQKKKLSIRSQENVLKKKHFIIVGEISIAFSVGGFYWLSYELIVILHLTVEWLKVNLPKLI